MILLDTNRIKERIDKDLNMEITKQIARWINRSSITDVPSKVLEKAKKSILDTIGVTLAGTRDEAAKIILQYIRQRGERPESSVIGTSIKTAAPLACLANGTMGHVLDFDDTTYSYIGHPSVSVLPAVLAVGEMMKAPGNRVLLAYVIGTEVAGKLGTMATHKIYEDGWHVTCIMGAFGAAAAAGKLLGLTEEQLAYGLAISASLVSGIRGNIGTHAKPIQVGRSSENGVTAALLSQAGATGAMDVFEKPAGFCDTFKVPPGCDSRLSRFGNPYELDNPGFFLKEFPSCSGAHAAMDVLIRLVKKYSIDPREVHKVECETTSLVEACLVYPEPVDAVQAKFSMSFCLASVLLGRGEVRYTDFNEEKVRADATVRMMKKIEMSVSTETAEKGFAPSDGPEAASVAVYLKNGTRYQDSQSLADWHPGNMPGWDTLIRKYRDCSTEILRPDELEQSIQLIRHIEDVPDIGELMDRITGFH